MFKQSQLLNRREGNCRHTIFYEKMKHVFTLKPVFIALLVMIGCTMKAETLEYTADDGFTYSLNMESQEASLKKYNQSLEGATKVVIPEIITYEEKIYKVTSLGERCFSDFPSLTSIVIPASVTSLREECFYGCSSIESMIVDANNPIYDSREGCNAIIETASNTMIRGCKNTRIPDSVISLGDGCFAGCSSLTSIEIPKSVTSLGGYCFFSCSSLWSIEIPESVTGLGHWCFWGCFSLNTLICKMENVIEDSSLFEYVPIADVTLYVPEKMLDTYKSTTPWSGFDAILSLAEEQVYVK